MVSSYNEKKKHVRINLGCGWNKLEGYINCDIDPQVKPDKIVDLSKRLPFKTNSVDEVFTSHTLEHIPQEILVNVTLPEIWRVCKKGAKVKIVVPYMDAQPVLNHYVRFSEDTFNNWCRPCYQTNVKNSDTFPFEFSFHVEKIELGKSAIWGWLHSLIPLKVWHGLWAHLIGEIRAYLVVNKDLNTKYTQ